MHNRAVGLELSGSRLPTLSAFAVDVRRHRHAPLEAERSRLRVAARCDSRGGELVINILRGRTPDTK